MANLYLDGIFNKNSGSPSTVRIWIPNKSEETGHEVDLYGLLIGEPTFSLQNKWGPIINDISNLTDVTSLMGSASLFTWIAASTNCWKGTSPISVNVSFYLINYKTGLNFEAQLRQLAKLAAIGESSAAFASSARSTVHGGYQANIFKSNDEFFTKKGGELETKHYEYVEDRVNAMKSNGLAKGAVQVDFGNRISIPNLLLVKIDITKSAVEVANSNGSDIKPLYYKVDTQFIGVSPITTKDVDGIFG